MIIHTIKFIPKNVNTYLNNKNKECVSLWDWKITATEEKRDIIVHQSKEQVRYNLSGEMNNYEASKDKLMAAALKNEEVEVKYIKKYLKRYINEVT